LSASFVACNDEPPTAPTEDSGSEIQEPAPFDDVPDPGLVLSDRAHVLPRTEFQLSSSQEELEAGLYRFRVLSDSFPTVERDDFIIGATDDESFVRLVLDAHVEDGTLVIDTGPAYWHDVLKGGTYELTIPLGDEREPTLSLDGIAQVARPFTIDSMQLPAMEATFYDIDVCQWLDSRWETRHPEPFCGAAKQAEETILRNVFFINGTLDSLKIVRGWVRLTTEADITITVDPGGLQGGAAPIFAPCNVSNYLGCASTPTGAALIDFLRRYAPSLPDASLPPIRVCIPGAYVRTARARWSGLTFHPAVWERCRIANAGELPSIVPGSLEATSFELRPDLQGQLDIRAKGDGEVGVEIAIPGLSASRGITSSEHFAGKVQIGAFLPLQFSFNNNAATVQLDFRQKNLLHQEWNPTDGISYYNEPVYQYLRPRLLEFDRPDSLVLRTGVMIKAEAVLCAAVVKCDLQYDSASTASASASASQEVAPAGPIVEWILGKLDLTEKFTIEGMQFHEFTWSREQIHPTDPLIDNWKIGYEAGWDGKAGFDIELPLEHFILPPVLQEGSWQYEASRSLMADYWGQARWKVTTTTTGVDMDPNGYTAVIQRTDSVPTLVADGAQRLGGAWQPTPIHVLLDPNGTKVAGLPEWQPCPVGYSDAAVFAAGPAIGALVEGLEVRRGGIPTYAYVAPCYFAVAPYQIELTDVAENCSVTDGAVRDSVWLQQSRNEPPRTDTTFVEFHVTCVAAGTPGDVRLSLVGAVGLDPRPVATMDGGSRWALPTDTLTLTGLTPGARVLQVTDLPSNCVSAPVDVTVTPGGTTDASAFVACSVPDVPPEGKVTYVSSVSGTGEDMDGYYVLVDGQPSAALASTDTSIVAELPGDTPTVMMVAGIAGNCRAESANPRVVTLNAVRDSVWVPFPVSCTAAAPDTVDAMVDATGWPSTTVTLRTEDGGSLTVNGPLAAELARLAGTSVRAWGITSATGINAYGYDLKSSLGDDRWTGIVLVRGGVTWLFGEDAIRLVSPPATLSTLEGAYVWVTGAEVLDGVQPTLFGVIRDPS
jgi:hypothetical protein